MYQVEMYRDGDYIGMTSYSSKRSAIANAKGLSSDGYIAIVLDKNGNEIFVSIA